MKKSALNLKSACICLGLSFILSFTMFGVFSAKTVVIQPLRPTSDAVMGRSLPPPGMPTIQFSTILSTSRDLSAPVNRIRETARKIIAPGLGLFPNEPSPATLDWVSILTGNIIACLGLAYGITGLGIIAMLLFLFLADRRTGARRKTRDAQPGSLGFAGKSPAGYEMAVLIPSAVLAGLPMLSMIVLGMVSGMVTGILRPHVSVARSALHSLMLYLPHGIIETAAQILCAAVPLALFLRLKTAGFPMASRRAGAAFMFRYMRSGFVCKVLFCALCLIFCAATIETFYTCRLAFYVDSLLSDTPINVQHIAPRPR